MGNIIFDCDKENIITGQEVSIPINKKPNLIRDENKMKKFINLIFQYFIKQFLQRLKVYQKEEISINQPSNNNNDNSNHLFLKNQPESNPPSNMDNLTLNSSMNKKYVEEDTQIIDNNPNSNNIINQNHKNETPDGNIIIPPPSDLPPKKDSNSPNKKVIKKMKIKKKSPQKTALTPIPEYPISNYDKSMLPGNLLFNFNDLPQIDKITEVENNIGGEFLIDEKELLKYMQQYPYVPKFFSIAYPSGEKYSGYFSPNWVKEVFGVQFDKNGSKYVGMFKNGMFEGRGRLILHKGDYYEGEFVENKANGQGKYVNAKGEIYNGYWIDDKQEGEGELILKDGSIYRGEFKNGKKNGKGKITWSDNSYYEGNFVNNYYEGYGVYIMINKRKGYLGEWKEGKMHGFGVFFWADGRSYKGYYEADKKNGYGIYSGKNNLRYEGKFKKGKQYGLGRIINENGEKQFGLYLKGKRLKYLNENDFKEDIKNLDTEIEKINNIFNNNEFFIKNKELMNITLDQT